MVCLAECGGGQGSGAVHFLPLFFTAFRYWTAMRGFMIHERYLRIELANSHPFFLRNSTPKPLTCPTPSNSDHDKASKITS